MFYKMKSIFSNQYSYNPDGVYILIERHQDRFMYNFGTDCTWKNINTGELLNNWDSIMRPLNQMEKRQFSLNQIFDYNCPE